MRGFIIDGKTLAREREELLKKRVDRFVQETGRRPSLVAVELSDDSGSRLYLKLKKAAAERVGIEFQVKRTVLSVLKGLSFQRFDGIFIQHPPGYDKKQWQKLVDQIPPEKDVDCLTTENLQLIKEGRPRFLPATVKAVGYCLADAFRHSGGSAATDPPADAWSARPLRYAKHFGQVSDWRAGRISDYQSCEILSLKNSLQAVEDSLGTESSGRTSDSGRDDIKDKSIVILGRSPIVGLPLFYWLKSLGAHTELLHSKTSSDKLHASCQRADILISTVGKPGFVTGDMVKNGVIIIDCGSPRADVAFSEVAPKSFAITPVPGGVGPLTVVSLMENVVQSAHLAGQKMLLTT